MLNMLARAGVSMHLSLPPHKRPSVNDYGSNILMLYRVTDSITFTRLSFRVIAIVLVRLAELFVSVERLDLKVVILVRRSQERPKH